MPVDTAEIIEGQRSTIRALRIALFHLELIAQMTGTAPLAAEMAIEAAREIRQEMGD